MDGATTRPTDVHRRIRTGGWGLSRAWVVRGLVARQTLGSPGQQRTQRDQTGDIHRDGSNRVGVLPHCEHDRRHCDCCCRGQSSGANHGAIHGSLPLRTITVWDNAGAFHTGNAGQTARRSGLMLIRPTCERRRRACCRRGTGRRQRASSPTPAWLVVGSWEVAGAEKQGRRPGVSRSPPAWPASSRKLRREIKTWKDLSKCQVNSLPI